MYHYHHDVCHQPITRVPLPPHPLLHHELAGYTRWLSGHDEFTGLLLVTTKLNKTCSFLDPRKTTKITKKTPKITVYSMFKDTISDA